VRLSDGLAQRWAGTSPASRLALGGLLDCSSGTHRQRDNRPVAPVAAEQWRGVSPERTGAPCAAVRDPACDSATLGRACAPRSRHGRRDSRVLRVLWCRARERPKGRRVSRKGRRTEDPGRRPPGSTDCGSRETECSFPSCGGRFLPDERPIESSEWAFRPSGRSFDLHDWPFDHGEKALDETEWPFELSERAFRPTGRGSEPRKWPFRPTERSFDSTKSSSSSNELPSRSTSRSDFSFERRFR
jgi:hypothetical protein